MTAARQFDHSIDEIKAALNARPVELAHALGLYGARGGNNYWVKDPRRGDGGNLTSFAIHLTRGIWKDWSQNEGGDLIKLVAVYGCGGDNARAVKWCLDWLGWTGTRPDAAQMAALQQRAREAEAKAANEIARHRRQAQALWLGARALTPGDPVWSYLGARGVDLARFKDGPPGALKFLPDCVAYPERTALPAMVACVALEGVGIMAVHRTYLAREGGVWRKAFAGQVNDRGKPVAAKRVLGSYAGGSIRLTRGATRRPLAKAPDGEWVAIGEGIENVLTVAQVRQDLRCLASVSLSNLANVALPPQLGGVFILADNDANPKTVAAFDGAMDEFARRGHEPVVVRVDGNLKDFNEAYQGAL